MIKKWKWKAVILADALYLVDSGKDADVDVDDTVEAFVDEGLGNLLDARLWGALDDAVSIEVKASMADAVDETSHD